MGTGHYISGRESMGRRSTGCFYLSSRYIGLLQSLFLKFFLCQVPGKGRLFFFVARRFSFSCSCKKGATMQTFLPYASFEETASILDWRRLGKQRAKMFGEHFE